jgi:ACR3 family arsenite efflux pump ArsB
MENLDSLFQNVTTSITTIEKKIIWLISVPAMLAILHILYPMLLGIYVEGKQVSDQEYRNYIFHISLAIQWIGIFSTFFIFRQLVKSKKYRTIGTIILFFTLQLP